MTAIDPARLITLITSLATPSVASEAASQTAKSIASKSNTPKRSNKRFDRAVLKEQIRSRLKKLDPEAQDYIEKATEITVQEVLQWQFGDKIALHSDYQEIVKNITQAIGKNEILAANLRTAVAALA